MIAILTDGTQEPWHQWFAWYPVKRNLWLTVSGDESSRFGLRRYIVVEFINQVAMVVGCGNMMTETYLSGC